MAKNSFFVTRTGIDVDLGGNLIKNQTLSYNLPEDSTPVGFGQSISPAACNKMIEKKAKKIYDSLIKNIPENATEVEIITFISEEFKKKRIATAFGKETLLRILSQQDCIGLQFINCISIDDNKNEKETILVLGIQIDPADTNKTIPIKNSVFTSPTVPTPEDPFIDEEGNGDTLYTILEEHNIKIKDLIKNNTLVDIQDFTLNLKKSLLKFV